MTEKQKIYTDNNSNNPRHIDSINARIAEVRSATTNGLSIFDFLFLRRLRQRIRKGDFTDDQ